MRSISGDDDGQDEKIFVSVRVRPMNAKESAKNDTSDWECVSNNTIIYKNSVTERSTYPNAYTFDRVYGPDISTRQVYDEGAKRVALSALNGINSSIFAYGQTSSGKTYTMTGVTQYAISDIFDYINKQEDRDFALKFSAIEIYNECVRDLLSEDNTQLRLLDDPEKGTVVDKLREIPLTDWTHLMELLAVCEAQRKIGETSMNELSSRSHQIIRLAIESSPSEFAALGNTSTLTATVNFVDLAGSERASQTLSVGTRLKEGGHINRSLLTLGTVIRKLSKGRNSHVPYRDSKLTRILQNSLGGNARTAIICTLSPAHTHLEQSRNTLLFAVCAKEVRTSAQVNVVMSEKALVKQLQREMARLANDLKNMAETSNDSDAIIKEKELQIQQMEQEMKALAQERDLARSRLEEILRAAGVDPNLVPWIDSSSWDEGSTSSHLHNGSWDGHSMSDASTMAPNGPLCPISTVNTYNFPENDNLQDPNVDGCLFENLTPREFMTQYFVPDPRNVRDNSSQKTMIAKSSLSICKEVECIQKDDANDQNQNQADFEDGHLEQSHFPSHEDVSSSKKRSTSCAAIIEGDLVSDVSVKNVVTESMTESKSDSNIKKLCRQDSHTCTTSINEKETKKTERDMFDLSPSSKTLEKVMEYDLKGAYQNYTPFTPKPEDSEDDVKDSYDSDKHWSLVFEEQRKDIIELWDECNIPLVHRTYFFMLIKGDPSDFVYIEVELRRLAFLKKTVDHAASERALSLERAMLSRKLLRKFTSKERETLFVKWGIDLESKTRRVQLSQLVWTKTDDMDHIRNSAEIVATLVGLIEPDNAPKELFALSYAPKQTESSNILSTWRNTLNLLRY